MFNIFEKLNFNDFIRIVEELTYYPYVKLFGKNAVVEITGNQSDLWFLITEPSMSLKANI